MYLCISAFLFQLYSIFKFAHGNESLATRVMVMYLYVCLVEYALGTSNKG